MKKLVYLGIGGIWVLILTFVISQWFNAPSKDVYESFIGYTDALKNYGDNKTVDPEKIEDLGPNTKFSRMSAVFFRDLQKIEIPLNDKYNAILVAKETSNLLNAEASARNSVLIKTFLADVAAAHTGIEAAHNKYAADIKTIPTDGLVYPIEPLRKSIADEVPKREEYKNNLLAVATYLASVVEFVESRRAGNYFTSDGQKITFSSAEDQKYYESLISQLDTKTRAVDKYRADLKSAIDATVTQLSANKKKD